MSLPWTKINDYSIKSGPWTLSKVVIKGTERFELWKDGQGPMVGQFETAARGKEVAAELDAKSRAHLGAGA